MHCQQDSVRLLHSMAWMEDDPSAEMQEFSTEEEAYARNWLMPLRRGLLQAYAVGTVDQAMMAVLFIKYGVLRLLGLAGKVLIIDEIHAYDVYMHNILERLLQWCRALEIPAVLLSATLPPEKKQSLFQIYTDEEISGQYPSITAVDESGHLHFLPLEKVSRHQQYRLQCLPYLHQPHNIAREAAAKVQGGGCLCVVLNTVVQAQQVYTAIQELDFQGTLLLFHARFPAGRKKQIEKKCIQLFGRDKSFRPQKAVLVATQVVEQSLDVDFDFMMSAAAPADLLIQRMGRQFRHDDTPRPLGVDMPEFTVLTPKGHDFEIDGAVYPSCILEQSVSLIEDREKICVPEDIAQLVADGYDMQKVPPERLEQWMDNLLDESIKGAKADQYKLWPPDKRFRPLAEPADFDDLEQQSYLSAKTRLSEPNVRIALMDETEYERLLALSQDGMLALRNPQEAEKVMDCSVSIRKKIYDALKQKYHFSDLSGDRLIAGIQVLSKNNPCLRDDPGLGILWEEK